MKRVSSVVWQFFDRLEENKRCVAVLCKLCDGEYKYFGNTTNLRVHLIKKHPIQWELRQNNWDGQKSLDDSTNNTFGEDDNSNLSPRKRKYRVDDKNVRYSLCVKDTDNSGTSGPESMPKIEIQRVDLLESKLDDNEDQEATQHLVRQMHTEASDEEWLDEDYHHIDMLEPSPKRMYAKVKREVTSPQRQGKSKYIVRSTPKPPPIISAPSQIHDEYSVFGEYIANKLRKFKAPRTRGNIQQLITTILWQAEYGMYDDADSVKRVLLCNLSEAHPETSTVNESTNDNLTTEIIVENTSNID